MYKYIIRPVLFLFTPEVIHHLVFVFLNIFRSIPGVPSLFGILFNVNHPKLEREVFGIKFPNPIGLAAGLDKDAEVFEMFGKMGFGFVEIGTVTPVPQPGNEKPRLFRLVEDKGLINRMGFNNKGVEYTVAKLKKKKYNVIIGGNIGKNKITENDQAHTDYLKSLEALHPYVDYFVVNVSSPNTPNLRQLQDKEPLSRLLTLLKKRNSEFKRPKPILLKIAPDLTNSQLDDIIEIVENTGIEGLVATNTTIARENLSTPNELIEKIGNGGLSGLPIKKRSTEVIRYIHDKTNGKIPIIGVGGIMDTQDVIDKLEAGAVLVQLFTGFIYQGPSVVKRINKGLIEYYK